jgi:hypothetical protein
MWYGDGDDGCKGFDCRDFLDIPPLVHWEDGSTCINPDFDAVRRYHLVGKARPPGGGGLTDSVALAPGDTTEFTFTVEREENGMGHFQIEELLIEQPTRNQGLLRVEIVNQQTNQNYTNGHVLSHAVFGDSSLGHRLPYPILMWPNQVLVIRVTSREGAATTVRLTARGRRFMPYHNPALVQEMEQCWAKVRSAPAWLGFDNGPVVVPIGGSAQGQVTVPGGWFELQRVLASETDADGGLADLLLDGANITVSVIEGRVGNSFMTRAIPLQHYAAQPLPAPGDEVLFTSSALTHSAGPSQFIPPNTRLVHEIFHNDGTIIGPTASNVDIIYLTLTSRRTARQDSVAWDLATGSGSSEQRNAASRGPVLSGLRQGRDHPSDERPRQAWTLGRLRAGGRDLPPFARGLARELHSCHAGAVGRHAAGLRPRPVDSPTVPFAVYLRARAGGALRGFRRERGDQHRRRCSA